MHNNFFFQREETITHKPQQTCNQEQLQHLFEFTMVYTFQKAAAVGLSTRLTPLLSSQVTYTLPLC